MNSFLCSGAFTNYVDKMSFFDLLPPPLTFSTFWTLTKSGNFWTTYPSPLVHVVCERPLVEIDSSLILFVVVATHLLSKLMTVIWNNFCPVRVLQKTATPWVKVVLLCWSYLQIHSVPTNTVCLCDQLYFTLFWKVKVPCCPSMIYS